jgi:CheY-specific phosphatase CheX
MKDAISEVLETMFFTSVDFENEDPAAPVCHHQSSISLHGGGRRFDIGIEVSESFARLITANLLGMDEGSVTADDIEDTMKELANMVVGNFQSRLASGSWELGIPRTGHPEGRAGKPQESLLFGFLGEPSGVLRFRCVTSVEKKSSSA